MRVPTRRGFSREKMKCVARISWTNHVGTYQSYRLSWTEDEEDSTVIECTNVGTDFTVKLKVRKGEVRTLARSHVEDGRATVMFEEHATGVTELDIREAAPQQLNSFLNRLQPLQMSRPSPARVKRKLNPNTR